MLLVDTCHVVETVCLFKCWPLIRFPPTVGKCEARQRTRQCLCTYWV